MSILSKIFSGGAKDLVEGVGGVLDNLTTTKAEKLEAKRKMQELIADYETKIAFEVEDKWTDLLQLVLITVIGAYFGGRTMEKRKK